MNLYKQFVKEKGLKSDYVKWLENKVSGKPASGALYDEPEIDENSRVDTSFTDDNGITIDYVNPKLGYEVEVVFPRHLRPDEQEQVENIIGYWSALPFVSVEGNYGIEWARTNKNHKAMVSIDFTKSASDDIGARQVLEQLGEWIWQGTPIRKRTNDRKWEGVIRPVKVSAGSM